MALKHASKRAVVKVLPTTYVLWTLPATNFPDNAEKLQGLPAFGDENEKGRYGARTYYRSCCRFRVIYLTSTRNNMATIFREMV